MSLNLQEVNTTLIHEHLSKNGESLGLVLKMDAAMKSSLKTKANYLVWDKEKFLGQFFTSKEVSAQLAQK